MASYRAEKQPYATADSGIQSGCIDFWQDEMLGDPEFYKVVLRPVVAELDAAADKVKPR